MFNRAQRRKEKIPTAPAPRSVEEVTKEYQQVSAAAISSQYQIYVHERALRELNDKMYELNREASERQKLDADAVKQEPAKETEDVKS